MRNTASTFLGLLIVLGSLAVCGSSGSTNTVGANTHNITGTLTVLTSLGDGTGIGQNPMAICSRQANVSSMV